MYVIISQDNVQWKKKPQNLVENMFMISRKHAKMPDPVKPTRFHEICDFMEAF